MLTNATVERLLNLSACYFGLRACGVDGAEGKSRVTADAGAEQGRDYDPAPRVGH